MGPCKDITLQCWGQRADLSQVGIVKGREYREGRLLWLQEIDDIFLRMLHIMLLGLLGVPSCLARYRGWSPPSDA
jgi:hypothetical protein